jgi:hypothetical protein
VSCKQPQDRSYRIVKGFMPRFGGMPIDLGNGRFWLSKYASIASRIKSSSGFPVWDTLGLV